MCLVLALSPYARAQQQDRRPAGSTTSNPTAGDNRNQASSATETIRGVIAGITAEGEVMFDYRTNKAVAAEAAFLTVVGSPVKMEGREATARTTVRTNVATTIGRARRAENGTMFTSCG